MLNTVLSHEMYYEGEGANAVAGYQESPMPAASDDAHILKKALVRTRTGMDFGAAYKKRNKQTTEPTCDRRQTLDDPCDVVVHEYGPEGYVCHKSKQKFTDVDQVLNQLPVLDTQRPEWANVRLHESNAL
jgi:hypothetical protein